jgi:hypothetical protein
MDVRMYRHPGWHSSRPPLGPSLDQDVGLEASGAKHSLGWLATLVPSGSRLLLVIQVASVVAGGKLGAWFVGERPCQL